MSLFETGNLLGLEIPPMSDSESKLWREDEIIQALAHYCYRTGVPSSFAWAHFVQFPPRA